MDESALQCGAHLPYDERARTNDAAASRNRSRPPLHNNCSGKHAGILALCVMPRRRSGDLSRAGESGAASTFSSFARASPTTMPRRGRSESTAAASPSTPPACGGRRSRSRASLRSRAMSDADAPALRSRTRCDGRASRVRRRHRAARYGAHAGGRRQRSLQGRRRGRPRGCRASTQGSATSPRCSTARAAGAGPSTIAALARARRARARSKLRNSHDSRVRSCIIGPGARSERFACRFAIEKRVKFDYLRLLGERVLLFDGAMGTQLMALELSAERFRRRALPRVQRGARARRARDRARDSRSVSRRRRRRRRNRFVYGLAPKARRVRSGRTHGRDQPPRRGARARSLRRRSRRRSGRASSPARWARPACSSRRRIRRSRTSPSSSLRDIYGEQARALVDGGVDLLLLETMQDSARAAKPRSPESCASSTRGMRRVPIQAQPTLITEGRMLLGTDIRAICATLDALPIDVIGLNCSTGPAQMRDSIRYLCENSRCFVSVIPNAGLPLMGPQGRNDLSRNAGGARARARAISCANSA